VRPFSWLVADYRGPGARLSGRAFFAPCTLHLAHFRPRGLGCAVALYTWASRGGDLGAHPRCSDSPPRFVPERPLRGPCNYLAYGRSTCAELASRVDTKVSHDDTAEWKEGCCVVPSSAPAVLGTPGRCGSGSWNLVADHLPRARAGVPADDAAALWLDPREPQGPGESSVPTLEASSAQVSGRRPHKTRAAKRPSGPSAEDCLSSEGGHRRLCAATSPTAEGSAPLRPRPPRRELLAGNRRASE
jgi:hypothetical protein